MKVFQVLPELNGGGVERGTLEMAAYLVKQGHQSVVVSAGGKLVEELVANGSRHIAMEVGKKRLSTLKLISKFRKLLKEEKPDILHLRSRLPAWIAYLAWKRLPKNDRPHLVTTVHGFNSVGGYSKIMCSGEKVIAVSSAIKDFVQRNYQVPDERVTVIHRGVTLDDYYPEFRPSEDWQGKFLSEFPKVKGKYLICLPGRVTQLKGHKDFFNMIQRLKQGGHDVHGLIVGGVHPKRQKYADELTELVKKMQLDNEITFTGHRSDLREIIAFSDLTVGLSIDQESFGRTCTETIALGRPFLGYAHGGIAEQLDVMFPEGKVPVGDYVGAAQKVEGWIKEVPQVDTSKTFKLEAMLEKTLKLYESF